MDMSVLMKVSDILIKNNMRWGLGASSMLYFHGLVDNARDIDLMVHEEDALAALELLRPIANNIKTDDGCGKYATRHFYEMNIDGQAIDLIGGYRILKGDWIYSFPDIQAGVLETVEIDGYTLPLTRIEDWYVAYLLMGDPKDRTQCIEAHFEKNHSVNRQALGRALEQIKEQAPSENALIKKIETWLEV
jgi:predicted nucleotidyltransferase